jgi:hypothetical protein
MTTLCYIEKDDSYIMMHRVKNAEWVPKSAVLAGEIL